jgi:hypothetical protein
MDPIAVTAGGAATVTANLDMVGRVVSPDLFGIHTSVYDGNMVLPTTPDLLMAAGTVVLFNLLSDTKAAGGTPTRTGRRLGVIAALVVGAAIGAGVARWQPWAAWTVSAAILAVAAAVTYLQFPRDPVLRSD